MPTPNIGIPFEKQEIVDWLEAWFAKFDDLPATGDETKFRGFSASQIRNHLRHRRIPDRWDAAVKATGLTRKRVPKKTYADFERWAIQWTQATGRQIMSTDNHSEFGNSPAQVYRQLKNNVDYEQSWWNDLKQATKRTLQPSQ